MKATLNIGLQWSERFGHGVGQWHYAHVLTVLKDHGFKVEAYKTVLSSSEPTLVVLCEVPEPATGFGANAPIKVLADALWQDCIATQWEDYSVGEGDLIGQYAGEWGKFDPAYFWGI